MLSGIHPLSHAAEITGAFTIWRSRQLIFAVEEDLGVGAMSE
jgi:hypothetical protein